MDDAGFGSTSAKDARQISAVRAVHRGAVAADAIYAVSKSS